MDEFLKTDSSWDADAAPDDALISPEVSKWGKRSLMTIVILALLWVAIAAVVHMRESAVEHAEIREAAEERAAEWEALGMDPHIKNLLERVTAIEFEDDVLERESWSLIDDLHAFDRQFRGTGWKDQRRQVGLVIDDPHIMFRDLKKRTNQLIEKHRLLKQRAKLIKQIEEL
ncbi:MAG TPA: hypothetical protein VK979_05350 [Guyparkeria sp.]|nr:hypothetical protein [Guyparkeria sp.]